MPMHRRHLLIGSAALLLTPLRARAAAPKDFDAKAFAAAQEAGQSIVVAINAPW